MVKTMVANGSWFFGAAVKMFRALPYLSTSVPDQIDIGPKAAPTIENITSNSDYTSVNARLQTFSNWPKSEVLKKSLASAGFVYTGVEDIVLCPICHVEGYHWEPADNPMDDHRTWSPNCPFLGNALPQTDGSLHIRGNQDTCGLYGIEVVPNSIPVVDLQRLDVTKSRGPIHPDMITVHSRLETFQTWPKAIKQRPEKLAEAGFF